MDAGPLRGVLPPEADRPLVPMFMSAALVAAGICDHPTARRPVHHGDQPSSWPRSLLGPRDQSRDRIVDLGPRRSHAVRPKSPEGPPPRKQATCLKPKSPARPPPTKPKAMPPVLKVEDKPKKPKQPPGPLPGWMSSPKVKALPMVREIRKKADDMKTPRLRDS